GEFDFGLAVYCPRKVLSIWLAQAQRNCAQLPATALLAQFYPEVQAIGGGRWPTSSLIARLRA
ncbi:oxidoreductase, partial [Pseudomonas aeruginosa]